jgi:hypothetical protein
MASAQKIVAFNDKRESVWDTDWICDFKTCPGNGYVVDHAINATAIIENDGSCLQSPMALGLSTLIPSSKNRDSLGIFKSGRL